MVNETNNEILIASNIHKHFEGVKALNGATLVVEKNKVISLIGPNGSGKTTLFNVITGWLTKTDQMSQDTGHVKFEDKRIDGDSPHVISLKGLMRTFQTTRNWSNLTVLENLMVVPPNQTGESFFNIFFKRKRIKEEEIKITLRALEILEFLEITQIRDQISNELSGGQLKLLAIGRLLMAAPRLILLDEPMAGVNPTLGNKIMDKIVNLKEQEGATIFLIEHNMDVVFNYSNQIFVMARGKVIAEGTPEEIQNNLEVIDAYLGADY